MQEINELYPLLNTPAKVVITTHQKPDPDAMGSSLGLYHLLTQLGHTVQVISPTNWAAFLDWMPGCETVLNYEITIDKSNTIINDADLIFCLDFNALNRVKRMAQVIEQAKGQRILIDHHREPQTEVFAYGVSDTSKSSTCEMVYDFIVKSGHADKLNMEMMECLYAGVIGDTGSFRFASASATVFEMVADFKRRGLEHTQIHENIYDNFLENRFRFIGHVWDFGHNNAFPAIVQGLYVGFGTHHHPASTGQQSFTNTCISINDPTCWKIGSLYKLQQFLNRYILGFDVGNGSIQYLGQVVRRHIGGHSHSNTRRSID